MLLSYSASNFQSFAERATVSLTLTQRDTVYGWDRTSPSGARATTALAVVGANGAGKSNLIKVGPFLSWFVANSFQLAPDEPIAFVEHAAHVDEPSEFEVETDEADGTRWRYTLHATQSRVMHESLKRKKAGAERFSYVFVRDWRDGQYEVRQQGFGLADSEANKVRQNVSLISWGRQYGSELAIHVSDLRLTTNLSMTGRDAATEEMLWTAAELFSDSDAHPNPNPLREQMTDLLTRWDLGLSDVLIQDFEVKDPHGKDSKRRWYPMGVHRTDKALFKLPFAYESSGTQSAFLLLWRLLPVLAVGGLAFIDELESDLHPHMIEPILRLFHDSETNPRGAQIIFTCQAPEVLKILQRSQVMFVEKVDCASAAFRGDEIENLTSSHNLYAKYMTGALGAVPQL